jgi:hypothetical protein
MATFPFPQVVDSKTFIKTVCHLYRISVIKVLPVSILLLLIYDFIRFGSVLFPKQYTHYHLHAACVALLIFLPLIGTLFCIQDAIGKEKPIEYLKLIIFTATRFLSLMGCLFSMLVFPGLIFLICIGVYFGLAMKGAAIAHVLGWKVFPVEIILGWKIFSEFAVFAAFVSKILAPILVFTDEQNANDAVDNSEKLIQGYFVRTFIFTLYAFLLLFFLSDFSYLATAYFHSLKHVSSMILEGIGQLLLLIIGPWSFALLLTQKYDLQSRVVEKPMTPKLKMNAQLPKDATIDSKDKLNF